MFTPGDILIPKNSRVSFVYGKIIFLEWCNCVDDDPSLDCKVLDLKNNKIISGRSEVISRNFDVLK